jgi:hypothetical protein
MKARTFASTVAVFLVAGAMCFASDPITGTWKLNIARSKFAPGEPRNTKVVCAAAGGEVKVITDGINTDGTPIHTEWTGKFDGQDYPVTGDANADTRSYTRISDHILDIKEMKGGKIVLGGRIVVTNDNRELWVTANRFGSGKTSNTVAYYDKAGPAQISTVGQTDKSSNEPKSLSMPFVTMAWSGVLTINHSEINEQVNNDKPGVEHLPTHFPYKDIEYCSYFDNREFRGVVLAGKQLGKVSGYGPALWIFIKRPSRKTWDAYSVPEANAKDFFSAAEVFGKHCGH